MRSLWLFGLAWLLLSPLTFCTATERKDRSSIPAVSFKRLLRMYRFQQERGYLNETLAINKRSGNTKFSVEDMERILDNYFTNDRKDTQRTTIDRHVLRWRLATSVYLIAKEIPIPKNVSDPLTDITVGVLDRFLVLPTSDITTEDLNTIAQEVGIPFDLVVLSINMYCDQILLPRPTFRELKGPDLIKRVLELRLAGHKYSDIGARLGIPTDSARRIFFENKPKGFSPRAHTRFLAEMMRLSSTLHGSQYKQTDTNISEKSLFSEIQDVSSSEQDLPSTSGRSKRLKITVE